jgi:hypothetical protein
MARFGGNRFGSSFGGGGGLRNRMLQDELMSMLRKKQQQPAQPAQAAAQASRPMAGFGPGSPGQPMMSTGSQGDSSGHNQRMLMNRMYGNNTPGSQYNVKKWFPPNNPMGPIFQKIRDKEREDFYKGWGQGGGINGSNTPAGQPPAPQAPGQGLGFPGNNKTVMDAMGIGGPAGPPIGPQPIGPAGTAKRAMKKFYPPGDPRGMMMDRY